jgi:glycosyltransferase involved in cell wall biosynthesis
VKVLLSAFECEPERGSEFAVGWNWALGLGRAGHDVTVLTRRRSKEAIERDLAQRERMALRFIYHEVPETIRWEKRGGLHLHYMVWQWQAAKIARALLQQERFDRVHHVTYAGLRGPSFMGRLGIPFVFGPVGGGESTPWRLRFGYHLPDFFFDGLRDLANLAVRFRLLMAGTFRSATSIYVTSSETRNLVPPALREKAHIELAIGIDQNDMQEAPLVLSEDPAEYRILYAGRFLDYKGMYMGLPAFAQLLRICPNARLTMVGDGPRRRSYRRLADRLGISRNIEWLGWQPHPEMNAIYALHHVMLFPSLHDTGGLVVLEALRMGLPVVCLKLGGPGTIVTPECGCPIEATGKSQKEVIRALADMLSLLSDPSAREPLARAAPERARAFTWQRKIERLYGPATWAT